MRVPIASVFFMLAACGGKILPSSSTNGDTPVDVGDGHSTSDVDAGTPSANDPFDVNDDWVGTFLCEGGPTKLDLRIVAMHDDAIDDALFQFDLDGVTGSYHVYGYFDPASGQAAFAPGKWIREPDGYTDWPLVGMSGNASSDSFTGFMSSTACGEIALTKQ